MSEKVGPSWISGFWRRLGALFIDALILGAAGLFLGLFLEDLFVQLGSWGRLIGFSIALIYFGVMNSSVMGGQTIGKKALKIRVVDSNNAPISLSRSVIRYLVIGVPFSINGAQFPIEAMLSYLMYPISFIGFGGLLSIPYLYVFNRRTRQSLHDLIVGSYVVNTNAEQRHPGNIWRIHIIVVAAIFIVSAIAPVFVSEMSQKESFKGMLEVQSTLSSNPDVAYVNISSGTSKIVSAKHGAKTTTYVASQISLTENNINDVELARRFASIVVASFPDALQKDTIQITLMYGYDIGIASSWASFTHRFNPRDLTSEQ